MRGIVGAGLASLVGLLICTVPTVVGAWFALRPSERLLALMRPLTLAAIFSALCSLCWLWPIVPVWPAASKVWT